MRGKTVQNYPVSGITRIAPNANRLRLFVNFKAGFEFLSIATGS